MVPRHLPRPISVFYAITTLAVGLLVHLGGGVLGPAWRDVLGDALWAGMIAWWAVALAPRVRLIWRGAGVYLFCVCVEWSQLYHTPALDAIRETRMGRLVLGSGFDPRDLAAYALGVAGAALLEAVIVTRRQRIGPAF